VCERLLREDAAFLFLGQNPETRFLLIVRKNMDLCAMLRQFILLIIWCISQTAFAQAQMKDEWQEMFIPKLAPLTLFDPYTPGVSLGLEFQPFDAVSIQFEYNLPFSPLSFFNYNTGKLDHKTTRYRGEFRYYPGRPDEAAAYYLALEGFFTAENYRRENSSLLSDNVLYEFTNSNINRTVIGGAIKGGYQFAIGGYLMLDVFAGIGVRNVVLRHDASTLFPSALLFDPRWGGDQKEGEFWRPHIALGLRLGVSLYERY